MIRWIKSVIKGWWYFLFKKSEVEDMAHKRAVYCGVCPHAVSGMFDAIHDDKIPSISGKTCNECGCALVAKLRSPDEECPIGLWGSEQLN